LHAKEVEVDGSRRSPGFASKDDEVDHPVTPSPFPEFLPVDERSFLAYSCAAARDFHPLPCLHRAAKTRVPNVIPKNNEQPTKTESTVAKKSNGCE
jgi:hypothetical protein